MNTNNTNRIAGVDPETELSSNFYTNTIKDDAGTHYRYSWQGKKLDPFRICEIYKCNLQQGTIVKKALRAGERGHKGLVQDLQDIICAANRWIEMIHEDESFRGICSKESERAESAFPNAVKHSLLDESHLISK